MTVADESDEKGYSLNPDSLKVVDAVIEPSIKAAKSMDRFQFIRNGYFVADSQHHTAKNLEFNRIVSLKSSFKPQK